MSTPTAQFLMVLAAKGTILLLVTATAALCATRARASMRHALWSAGLTALLLVPAMSAGLPRWRVVSLPIVTALPDPVPAKAGVPPLTAPNTSISTPSTAGVTRGAPIAPSSEANHAASSSRPPFDAARAIVSVWIAGVGLALSWLLLGHIRVRAMVRRARLDLSPEWSDSTRAALDLVAPRGAVEFRETRSSMPMATGVFRAVVLLPSSGAAWTAAHRRDVVIHELAHVQRRDCLTHLACQVACAMHWFNPLAWLAARQARVEREHACDDAVLAAGAMPSSYAQALLDTAREAPAHWATASAGLTMARPSHLANRLLAVLDSRRHRGQLGRMALGAASFGTLALLAPIAALAPRTPIISVAGDTLTPSGSSLHYSASTALPEPIRPVPHAVLLSQGGQSSTCQYNKHGSNRTVRLNGSMSISGTGSADDGRGTAYVAWTGTDCSVVIRIQGQPTFTADERDIASFAGAGSITMTDAQGDQEREYNVRGSGTSLTRRYRVNGADQPMSEEAKAWIAELVLQYIRQSGYQAEARATRILAARGMNGLFQEIVAITSDYSRARYYAAILPSRKDAGEVSQLLDHAGTTLESDYEKGRVLSMVPPPFLGDARVRTSYLAASKSMESDYEKSKALLTITAAGLDPASTRTALQAATSVSSDYERARVLAAVVGTTPAGQDIDPLYFEAAQPIESDYEKARVLTIYAQRGGLSEASLGRLYAAAATITSSNELSNLLLATIAMPGAAAARCEGYLAAVKKIDSDNERARALSGILSVGALSPVCAKNALDLTASIDSDNEQAGVLINVLGKGLLTEATRPDFFRSVSQLESSYERRRVLIAVLARGPVSDAIMGSLLGTAEGIDSDNDLSTVLVAAAGTGALSPAIRAVYLKTAGRLSSDYERRRALTAIGEKE